MLDKLFCQMNGCCGIALKTAVKVISIFEMVISVWCIYISSKHIHNLNDEVEDLESHPHKSERKEISQQVHEAILKAVCVILTFDIILSVIQFFFNALLCYGVYKNKPRCILTWIIYNLTLLGIMVLLAFISLCIISDLDLADLTSTVIGVYMCAQWFLMAVVYAYYKEVKTTADDSPAYNQVDEGFANRSVV